MNLMNRSYSRIGKSAWTPLALFSMLSASILPAAAQSSGEQALAPVVVTAARTQQLQTDALPHTTVLTADDIRNSQAVDLPSLLRHEAGLQLTRTGGYGSAAGLFMRGTETRQTLVLIDGVPLTKQDATGTTSIEHLMLDQIDRIEIVRGNVSAIHGSGAIGGVIQVFTKRGEGPPRVSVNAEAGSRDTQRLSAGVSGSSGALRYSLAASNFRTDGISTLNPAQFPTTNPDNDGYRNTSVSGALSTAWANDQELGVRFSAARGKFDYDSSFGARTDIHTGKTDVDTMTVFSQNRFSADWTARLSYAESRDENANTSITGFGPSRNRFESKTRLLQWNHDVMLSTDWTATAGVERQWQELDSDNGFGTLFGTKRNTGSVYAGVQGKTGPHQLQLNARHDRIDNVDSASTGYFGYGYNISERVKAIASLSSAFSAPTLGYLYSPSFGNPALKPERARSAEVGLQYAAQRVLVRATVFSTRVKEQLQYDLVSNRFDNISRASNRGLEVSASGKLSDTDLRASLTLQDPRDDITDQRLRRRAKTLASLSANRSFGPWQAGGDLSYTGSRPDAANRLGSYWLANLTARYAISKSLSVFGRVENLFDRDYQTAYGYNQLPRGVFVGLSWQP